MKIAVTGATGHVGNNLVRALLADGHQVRAMVHEHEESLSGLDIERVQGDVLNRESLRHLIGGTEVVFHLAAIISIIGDRNGLVSSVNITGPRNVAEIALESGVRRMVHFSSIHAFDLRDHSRSIDESHPRADSKEHYAYDRSKVAGEREVERVMARGLDAVFVHPSGVIGPYDFGPSRMGRVFLSMGKRTLPAFVPGGFNWVDVRDVVDGAIRACEHGGSGEHYLLTGHWTEVATLGEFVYRATGIRLRRPTVPNYVTALGLPFMDAYGRWTGREPLYTTESLGALRANPCSSNAKAQRELGYRPRPLLQSVEDVYQWFVSTGRLEL